MRSARVTITPFFVSSHFPFFTFERTDTKWRSCWTKKTRMQRSSSTSSTRRTRCCSTKQRHVSHWHRSSSSRHLRSYLRSRCAISRYFWSTRLWRTHSLPVRCILLSKSSVDATVCAMTRSRLRLLLLLLEYQPRNHLRHRRCSTLDIDIHVSNPVPYSGRQLR